MLFTLRFLLICIACTAGLAYASDSRNLAAQATTGSKRVALVIGNGAYQHPDSLPKLSNPAHDAEDIANALRGFGFEVIERKDQSLEGMNNAIAEFSRKIGNSEAALFYFAGHGLQVKGQNYLVPVDANIETEARVQYVSVNVNQILDEMDSAKSHVNIVMLDACRNNPISGKFRSGGMRGLAPVTSQPKGTVIVYATDPGNVAADGEGRNGLFTAGLLTAFKGSDLSLAGVLTRASEEVERGSDQKQTPYINGPATLQKNFRFSASTQVANLTAQFSGARTAGQIEDELWDAIKDGDKVAVFEEYIKQYSKGRYLVQARIKIAKLKADARQLAAASAVALAPTLVASSDPDIALWSEVQKGNSVDDYDVYIRQYPKGKYVALAKQRLQRLKDEARQKAEAEEQSVWQAAEGTQTGEGYAAYLASYPRGKFTVLAQARADKLKREAADQERQNTAWQKREQAEAAQREEAEQWRKAEAASDSATVQAYLDRYPAGRNVVQARLKLAEVTKKEAEGPSIGVVFKDCADCPEMVRIPAGSFEMGGEWTDEKPVHTVRIGKPLAMGKTEVTQGQWRAVMGSNPSHFSSCGDTCPVEKVSWNDIREFLSRLSQKTGKTYRLPSESEWEYACRAGGRHKYCGGDSEVLGAWYDANSRSKTHSVAGKQANAWGLHDMSGNVWEWVEDCYHGNYSGAPTDGSARTGWQCASRVLRGGSWLDTPDLLRTAGRVVITPDVRSYYIGFRVAR